MTEAAGTPSQDWSAEGYAHNARLVAELGEPVVDSLDPRPGERVLDVGCGDGALAPSLRGRAGSWTADYVRLRFAAQLES